MTSYVSRDAPVRTLDEAGTVAEALAVRDGRIAAVGSLDEAIAAAGPDARRISTGGAVVLPGLVDTYPHTSAFFSSPCAALDRTAGLVVPGPRRGHAWPARLPDRRAPDPAGAGEPRMIAQSLESVDEALADTRLALAFEGGLVNRHRSLIRRMAWLTQSR